MTNERHALIRAVFLEAASAPAALRSAFLDRRCGDDDELRAEVEKLLLHHVQETLAQDKQPSGAAVADVGQVKETAPRAVHQPQAAGHVPGTAADLTPGTLTAGDVIAGRYRIVSLLGQGGMGSVYRADDLTLDQPVAIKFLDPRFAERRDWIARFRNEVRLARVVTHPNVCRVFDIGEADGRVFLSMEYVDGEDLASLLQRVGRLSLEKAVDVARQVCTGLAAAHGAGVLHRDLKPANIMLDGRGQVRLTDFGIAVAAETAKGLELRVGTPAYMAPEQLAGRGVDVRSDIYSLGLVLYELFSGQPVFRADSVKEYTRLHEQEEPPPLSQIVPGVDVDVERLVQQCLRKNPSERPPSALAVAAALPGVDVLSVALAANQTPPPTLVAGAQDAAVRVTHPLRLAVFVLAACVALPLLRSLAGLPWERPNAKPPLVLAERAREALAAAGHSTNGLEFAVGYCTPKQVSSLMRQIGAPPSDAERLPVATSELLFWYRQAPHPLAPHFAETLLFGNARVSLLDPPAVSPGHRAVILDQRGRLVALIAIPRAEDFTGESAASMEDVAERSGLWAAAELDPAVRQATPFPDTGILGAERCESWQVGVRAPNAVLARSCSAGNKIVLFTTLQAEPDAPFAGSRAISKIFGADLAVSALRLLFIAVTLIALPLAWKNYRAGRSDVSGSLRTGLLVFTVQLLAWVLGGRQVPLFATELMLLSVAVFRAMGFAGGAVVLYLALEPSARRYWPHLLIGWTRLLQYRRADSLVWQHVLVGAAIGCLWAILFAADWATVRALGWTPREPFLSMQAADRLAGGGAAAAACLRSLTTALGLGLLFAVLLALVRAVVQSPMRAALLVGLLLLPVVAPRGAHPATSWALVSLVAAALGLWTMIRYGLLAIVVGGAVAANLNATPLRIHENAWYASQSFFLLVFVGGIALYAITMIRRSQRLEPRGAGQGFGVT